MTRSIKSLVGVALQDWGSEESWQAIADLQMLGSPTTLAAAQNLAKSRNWRKRALGLYIASQLHRRDKRAKLGCVEYALDETKRLLVAGLQDERDEVVCAAISGMGHRPDASALPKLVELARYTNQEIRLEVAVALGSYDEAEAIETLLILALDTAADVRDWATFGIGSMHETDTPEIREVLWKNLQDEDDDVRGEALVGLAKRKDERIVSVLNELLDGNCRAYELEAAELMASPLLLKNLEAIKSSIADTSSVDLYWYGRLSDAIEACKTP